MENKRVTIDESIGNLSVFQFRELLGDVSESFTHEDEYITSIGSYEANLYVGTSRGNLLHYHHFEDAPSYIFLTQLQVSSEPIVKFVVLPQTKRALILSGKIATLYSLPELTPSQIGKLKDTNDISLLSYSVHANTQNRATIQNDKIIAFTSAKIRILQINVDSIKLLKDVNYSKAVKGASTASTMSSNYSNLVLVANDKNYDIIDLKHTRKIPLFEYCPGSDRRHVDPAIVPFNAKDKSEEEYLLTISSDETTSMSMFINSLGDVTRGTISWMDHGYPSGGVVVEWPFVVGLFNSEKHSNQIIFSSLETLEISASINLGTENATETSERVSESKDIEDASALDNLEEADNNKGSANTGDQLERPEDEQEQPKTNEEINEEDQAQTTKDTEEPIPEIVPVSAIIDPDTHHIISEPLKLCKVTDVRIENSYSNQILSKINFQTQSIVESNNSENDVGTILLYGKSKVWLTHRIDQFTSLQDEFEKHISGNNIADFMKILEPLVDTYNGTKHEYLVLVLIVCYFSSGSHVSALKYLTRIKNGQLLVNPLLLINLLSSSRKIDGVDNFGLFKGIYDSLALLDIKPHSTFLVEYLKMIFPDLVSPGELTSIIRIAIYQNLSSIEPVLEFFEQKDRANWGEATEVNQIIMEEISSKFCSPVLIHIYDKLLNDSIVPEGQKQGLAEKYCSLSIDLMHENDAETFKNLKTSKPELIDQLLKQLQKHIENEISYTTYVLEILKIDKDRTFQYLKKNKGTGKFKDIHLRIMDEISHSHSDQVDFSLLRIEYLEAGYMDDLNDQKLRDELLAELIKLLVSENILNDENVINFEILVSTYGIENSLQESKWPKISWTDYIHLNLKRNEGKDLLNLYLKSFELLQLSVEKSASIDMHLSKLKGKSVFSYFNFLRGDRQSTDVISQLLEFHDFSSAEYYAVHGSLPSPSISMYPKNSDSSSSSDAAIGVPSIPLAEVKSNLEFILEFYVGEEKSDSANIYGIQHFTVAYGTTVFTPPEMLTLLPSYVPIIHLLQYLEEVIIDLKVESRKGVLRKSLSKADSTFTKKLYSDITKAT